MSLKKTNLKNGNGFIKKITRPGNTLKEKTVKGGFWVFSLKLVQRLFSLTRLIILARFLSPADFGLMGIALLTMATLNTFSQTGFQAALIQKKENIESYLDSAWTIIIIRGIILFLVLYFIAPYAAIFFKSPKALPIIRVIGFSFLIQAFTNIGVIYFQKELEFNKQFIYQFIGTLADFIVAVLAVIILRNVWAIVFGLLASNVARLIASYFIHPYRPHLSSNLGKAKELFGFGKWILSSSILIFLLTQGDDAFVGKFLGAAALGFYQLAYRISNMAATEITHVISQVTFPAYSKLQDDIPKLREFYLKVLQLTAFLSFPITGLIFVLAPDFTRLFLGEKWMPMVPAMQVLCIYGIIRALAATTGSLFQGFGKPKILTKLAILQFGILIGIIYSLTIRWGILGTSIAVVIANFITQGVTTIKTITLIKAKILDVLKLIVLPAVATFSMVLSVWLIRPISIGIVCFLWLALIGILIYLTIIYILDRKFDINYREIFNQVYKVYK